MIKMAALTVAISGALRERGVSERAAELTAQAGITVFQTAFERWATGDGPVEFPLLFQQVLDELRDAVGGTDHRIRSPHVPQASSEPPGSKP